MGGGTRMSLEQRWALVQAITLSRFRVCSGLAAAVRFMRLNIVLPSQPCIGAKASDQI